MYVILDALQKEQKMLAKANVKATAPTIDTGWEIVRALFAFSKSKQQ